MRPNGQEVRKWRKWERTAHSKRLATMGRDGEAAGEDVGEGLWLKLLVFLWERGESSTVQMMVRGASGDRVEEPGKRRWKSMERGLRMA